PGLSRGLEPGAILSSRVRHLVRHNNQNGGNSVKRFNLSWVLLAALTVPAIGSAQPQQQQQISCVRGGLQRAVNLYIEAQTKGDTAGLPLANGLGYYENNERID